MLNHKISRRSLLRASAMAGAGAVLAACQPAAPSAPQQTGKDPSKESPDSPAGEAPQAEAVTVTLWSWAEANFPHYEHMAELWNSTFTDRPKINFESVLIPDSEQTLQKGMNAMAAGSGIPDIFLIEIAHVSKFLKGEPSLAEQYLLDYVPGLDAFNSNWRNDYLGFAPYSWKGKVFGIEIGLCPTAYYYRADLFEEAGIEMPIATWEDFIAAGEIMKEKGHAMVAFDATGPNDFNMLFYQSGGVLFDENGELRLEDERAYKTMDMLIETARSGIRWSTESYWGPPHYAALNDGTVAGVLSAMWYSPFQLKVNQKETAGKWRVQPMPTWKTSGPWGGPDFNTRNTSTWGGSGLTIPKVSANPDVTFEYLAFSMLTEEGGKSVYLNMGQMPVVKTVIHDETVTNNPDEFYGGQSVNKVFADIVENIPLKHPNAFWNEAEQEIIKNNAALLAGEGTGEELVKQVATRIKDIIAQG